MRQSPSGGGGGALWELGAAEIKDRPPRVEKTASEVTRTPKKERCIQPPKRRSKGPLRVRTQGWRFLAGFLRVWETPPGGEQRRTQCERLRTKNQELKTDSLRVDDGKLRSTVGIAEIDAALGTLVLQGLAFGAFILGDFFFGVGEGIARGEHGVGLGGFFLFLAQLAKLVAHLANRRVDGFDFHQQIADFFQKIVKMERAQHIREP